MSKIFNIFFFEDSYGEFKKWLESREVNEVVGKSNSHDCCPLATCTNLSIGEEVFHEKKGYKKYKLPNWAIKFVQLVDDTEKNKLTAGDCLSILRKISV